jgi:hypothetical protein
MSQTWIIAGAVILLVIVIVVAAVVMMRKKPSTTPPPPTKTVISVGNNKYLILENDKLVSVTSSPSLATAVATKTVDGIGLAIMTPDMTQYISIGASGYLNESVTQYTPTFLSTGTTPNGSLFIDSNGLLRADWGGEYQYKLSVDNANSVLFYFTSSDPPGTAVSLVKVPK